MTVYFLVLFTFCILLYTCAIVICIKLLLTYLHVRTVTERVDRTTNSRRLVVCDYLSQVECGPMPNVMAALPNIDGALYRSSLIAFLVPRRKVWLTPTTRMKCSNAANIGERMTWT